MREGKKLVFKHLNFTLDNFDPGDGGGGEGG